VPVALRVHPSRAPARSVRRPSAGAVPGMRAARRTSAAQSLPSRLDAAAPWSRRVHAL